MARRNALFEIKQIEQLALIAGLSAHHGPSPSLRESNRRNHESPKTASPFSTASVKRRRMSTCGPVCSRKQTSADRLVMSQMGHNRTSRPRSRQRLGDIDVDGLDVFSKLPLVSM